METHEKDPNSLSPRAYLVHNDWIVGDDSASEQGIRLKVKLHHFTHFPSRMELRFCVRYNSATMRVGEQISVYLTRHHVQGFELAPWSDNICAFPHANDLCAGRELLALHVRYQIPESKTPHARGLYTSQHFAQKEAEISRLRNLFRSHSAEFHLIIEVPPSASWKDALLHMLRTRFSRENTADPLCRFTCYDSQRDLNEWKFTMNNVPPIEKQILHPIDTTIRTVFMDMNEYAAIMVTAYQNGSSLRRADVKKIEKLRWVFHALHGSASGDGAMYGFLIQRKSHFSANEGREVEEEEEEEEEEEGEILPEEEGDQEIRAAITNGTDFRGTFHHGVLKGDASYDCQLTVVDGLPLQPQGSIPVRLVANTPDTPPYIPPGLSQLPPRSPAVLSDAFPFWIRLLENNSVLKTQVDHLDILRRKECRAHLRRLLLGNEPNDLERPGMSLMERLSCPSRNIDDYDGFLSLDEQQKEAVQQTMVEKAPAGVVLIAGSRGTGKTRVVEESVRHIIRQNANTANGNRLKVLVLSKFRAVVKRLADSLVSYGMDNSGVVVQHEGRDGVFNNVTGEAFRRNRGGAISGFNKVIGTGSITYWILKKAGRLDETTAEPDGMEDAVDWSISDDEDEDDNVYASRCDLPPQLSSFSRCFEKISGVSISDSSAKELKDRLSRAVGYIMNEADVVVATVHAGGHDALASKFQADVIYILNCDMVSEPDMWPILASQKSFQSLTLLGDLRPPLPPIPATAQAAAHQSHPFKSYLETSFFQRLHDAGTRCVRLTSQYTMHSDIGELVNLACYNDRTIEHCVPKAIQLLGNQISAFNKTNFGHSKTVTFLSTSGSMVRSPIARTVLNRENINKVQQLLELMETQQLVPKRDIMILTPYRGQYWEYVAKRNMSAFAGVQARIAAEDYYPPTPVVILDLPTTGSTPGFVRNLWRLRSCLATAAVGLYIIGDETLLDCDDRRLFGRFVQFCRENDLIFPKRPTLVEEPSQGRRQKKRKRNGSDDGGTGCWSRLKGSAPRG